jgi:hypothetical protein
VKGLCRRRYDSSSTSAWSIGARIIGEIFAMRQ